MKRILSVVTGLSLRFRYLTLVLAIAFLILGVVAASELNQELLPPIDLPQTIILAQASGMTTEQVMNILTQRIEPELAQISDIINIESTTTGAFGSVIIAYNDYGINQARLQAEIQAAIDRVWLPLRRIQAPVGERQAFVSRLLSDLTPEIVLFLAEADPNFLFQLSPEVWGTLADETLRAALGYLSVQGERADSARGALQRLVEKDIVPQLRGIDLVANVVIAGGQVLPGEESALTAFEQGDGSDGASESLLLTLSPRAWEVIASRIAELTTLDASAVEFLSQYAAQAPVSAPELPESWQVDHFHDATDLLEIRTLTTSIADILNDFYTDGYIVGALGQVDDLTPEIVERMLSMEPGLVEYFQAEHLSAMSPDVFAVLPDDFINNLDGFTRDALAAAVLAESITGISPDGAPVELPSQWRIQAPQLIAFSFADIPLATFSISSTRVPDAAPEGDAPAAGSSTEGDAVLEDAPVVVPEGPALPEDLAGFGSLLGIELNTADDIILIELPPLAANALGIESLSASDLLNFLALLADPASLPEGVEIPALPIALDAGGIIGDLTPEAIAFLAEYGDDFLNSLSPAVFNLFSDETLLAFPPLLADAWDVLASQAQFSNLPLRTAADIAALGDGSASSVLETINDNVPARFEGYEVRLFDSLTPADIRYFLLTEAGFYDNLDPGIIEKFSAQVLANLPDAVFARMEDDAADRIRAIASGDQPSAFAALEEALYSTNVIPPDPSAPALNPEWQEIAGFVQGVREFNNAFDLFRFPEATGTPAQFINGLFDSPGGRNFAPGLLGGMSVEAFNYIAAADPTFITDLIPRAILLLSDEVKAILPPDILSAAIEGGQVFTPTTQVTRNNGAPSLLLTVFKTADANTVAAYAQVERVLRAYADAHNDINLGVVFEQSSFIEESISGVVREASLGAVFAVTIILIFLSGGIWSRNPRRVVGSIMVVVFSLALIGLVIAGLDAADGSVSTAFAQADTVLRVLLIAGTTAGLVVLFWPGDLPDPAWRATLVIAVSIPLSVLMALIGMRWLSPFMHQLIAPLAEDSGFFTFILRLFPDKLTLNIMTLSGLTVAIGRVVDDSIVVLENIFKQLQAGGMTKRDAILSATRDVSAAIFTATLIAVVVFLPLGLTGGIIGAFFLPFGLAVTYALAGSFLAAVTVVPALAYLFISLEDMPEEGEFWVARYYIPVLRWTLSTGTSRAVVLGIAVISMLFGFFLFGQRPFAFLPNFGEPQITISIELPGSTRITETNQLVLQMERAVQETIPAGNLRAVQTTIGGGGELSFEAFLTGGTVAENVASLIVGLHVTQNQLTQFTQTLREQAVAIFGEENVVVSGASIAEGGFGGFALVVSGPQGELARLDPVIIEALNAIDGIANVSSNLSEVSASGDDGPTTLLRVNQVSAVSYTAELETQDTIGVTRRAIEAIRSLPDLPEGVNVSQGFQSEIQEQGFASLFVAMAIALVIVVVILAVTFGSLVYWLAIILSVVVAPVGAAVALTLTDRVLGISALIGLLMLLGLVITNAVVLIDRVRSNRTERGMALRDALIEAGGRRLRPILMTSLTTIIALIPLTVGLSEGAIIASELGTVVVGGVFSSTLLTLIVVPVAYSLLHPIHQRLVRLVGGKGD